MGRRLVGALILLCACERGEIVVGNRWVRGGSFSDDRGMMAFPYSDVRFRVDRNFLYVILYAGDEDIRSRDKFDVVVAPLRFEMAQFSPPRPPRSGSIGTSTGRSISPATSTRNGGSSSPSRSC